MSLASFCALRFVFIYYSFVVLSPQPKLALLYTNKPCSDMFFFLPFSSALFFLFFIYTNKTFLRCKSTAVLHKSHFSETRALFYTISYR